MVLPKSVRRNLTIEERAYMSPFFIWDFEISENALSPEQIEYLRTLPLELPSLEWVWKEMDRVWGTFGLNNRLSLSTQPIGEFYMHPVWLMNGIFSASDPASRGYRRAIAACLKELGAKRIADYGGGFGELALQIAHAIPEASVSIVEPFPLKAGFERIRHQSRIGMVADLSLCDYDAIIAQDVLEHVEDPILLAYRIADSVQEGGCIIFANCFYPVIQCHLPSNFHLRHTFWRVMKSMGLNYKGKVPGAEYAEIFERTGQINLSKARSTERFSKLIGPLLILTLGINSRVKRMLASR